MSELGRSLVTIGLGIAALGALLMLAGRAGLPLGRLPGDFAWKGKGFSVYLPIASCLVVSLLLTLLANLFFRNR